MPELAGDGDTTVRIAPSVLVAVFILVEADEEVRIFECFIDGNCIDVVLSSSAGRSIVDILRHELRAVVERDSTDIGRMASPRVSEGDVVGARCRDR